MARVELSSHDLQECMAKGNPNLHLDDMMRKFKKQVINDEIIDECKRREFFLKKSIKRREKAKRAKIRALKSKNK